MEEQKNPSKSDYTYEELKMMYLGKKAKNKSQIHDVGETKQNIQSIQQEDSQNQSESYEALRQKYLVNGGASKQTIPKKPRSTMQMVCDIIIFCNSV